MEHAVKVSDDPSLDKDSEAADPGSGPFPADKPLQQNADLERGHPTHLNSARSQRSLRSVAPSNQSGFPAGDIPWGPSHPCFPHPNPHVPLNSPLYASTRIIRIRRDWMIAGDLAPTFSNIYPEILEPWVSEQDFRTIIKRVNSGLIAALDPWGWRNWVDAVLGVATGWLWEDLGAAGVKRKLKGVEGFLEDWNRRTGEKEGVRIVSLRRTAYLSLDFQIPDPQVGLVEAERPATRPGTEGNGTIVGPDGES
ncbi:hypothetical protein MMC08_007099 [Hypocenomyce scalaris]|nr:hypothetical protein [Hypocenomyce scalaris]